MGNTGKKCPHCLLCLDIVYYMPKRFFHCYLCGRFYDFIDSKITEINPDAELKKHLELLMGIEETRTNESAT